MWRCSVKEQEDKMSKTIESLKHNFATVRTGRANPEILHNVKVDCYGTTMPISQTATMHVQEGNSLVITPFDRANMASIEKAIMKADLGLTPSNDGVNIRITIPPLNEERRKELDKVVKKMAEESKVGIRNIRRDVMERVKKDEELSEDDRKRNEHEIQKITDNFIHKVEELLKIKESEIMEI
ncbi:MAG: ribosome recycling factor [Candidatus Margulisbacteria bacterium GWF2_35_9]|nr:MAG: ribosome recycling factor [Candidatus Margulisbacteria bacterium GWF2_35_9]